MYRDSNYDSAIGVQCCMCCFCDVYSEWRSCTFHMTNWSADCEVYLKTMFEVDYTNIKQEPVSWVLSVIVSFSVCIEWMDMILLFFVLSSWQQVQDGKIPIIRFHEAIILSTLLYGAEIWPLTVTLMKRLEAGHHRWLCSVLDISWKDMVTSRVRTQSIENIIRQRSASLTWSYAAYSAASNFFPEPQKKTCCTVSLSRIRYKRIILTVANIFFFTNWGITRLVTLLCYTSVFWNQVWPHLVCTWSVYVDLLYRLKTVTNINGTFMLYNMKRICPLLKLTMTLNCSL